MIPIPDQKRALRKEMKARRAEAARENPGAALALRDLFLRSVVLPAKSVVSFYYPRDTEIDPTPLAEALYVKGHILCLPVIENTEARLLFRRYAPGDSLKPQGSLHIMEPLPTAPYCEPDSLLVPLLAFDRTRHRLGYGGGYYDRLLTNLRSRQKILAIGIAFAAQEVPAIPAGPFDARLDKIVTNLQVF
jgi:5-formyltetrahydrofolate cyclo-ligase